MGEQRVAVAKVRRPWGTDGSIAVVPWADDPVRLTPGATVFAGGQRYTVASVRRAGTGLALKLAEVGTPEEAAKLRGLDLEVPASELPENPPGVYYHYQIIGSEVVTPSGKKLGRVFEILETPGNDVYVVRPDGGGPELLAPAVKGVIKKVDTAAGVITIDLPEGMPG